MRRPFIAAVFLFVSFVLATSTFARRRSDIGVLVIAHGSGETWNAPVIAAVERVRARMPAAVGFLMGKGAFGIVDNVTNSQDPNSGLISSTGSALPIYRPEIGRTLRIGNRWNWTN